VFTGVVVVMPLQIELAIVRASGPLIRIMAIAPPAGVARAQIVSLFIMSDVMISLMIK